MRRDKVEEFIGKQVVVTLFDKTIIVGELHKTGEEQFKDDSNLYIPSNYYFLINPQSCLFRSSHITKVSIVDKVKHCGECEHVERIEGRNELMGCLKLKTLVNACDICKLK